MYVSTFVAGELRTAREVRSEAGTAGTIHDARNVAQQVVARLEKQGWKLHEVAKDLWLGCTNRNVVAAVHAGSKPERFASVDRKMQEKRR